MTTNIESNKPQQQKQKLTFSISSPHKNSGAYGIVLKCRDKETGAEVAIKKFKESEDDDLVRKTTLREVKVLQMLNHPNIVNLIDAFHRTGKLYLVFEYVEKTVLEILEEHPYGVKPDLVCCYLPNIFQIYHQTPHERDQ